MPTDIPWWFCWRSRLRHCQGRSWRAVGLSGGRHRLPRPSQSRAHTPYKEQTAQGEVDKGDCPIGGTRILDQRCCSGFPCKESNPITNRGTETRLTHAVTFITFIGPCATTADCPWYLNLYHMPDLRRLSHFLSFSSEGYLQSSFIILALSHGPLDIQIIPSTSISMHRETAHPLTCVLLLLTGNWHQEDQTQAQQSKRHKQSFLKTKDDFVASELQPLSVVCSLITSVRASRPAYINHACYMLLTSRTFKCTSRHCILSFLFFDKNARYVGWNKTLKSRNKVYEIKDVFITAQTI